MKMRNDIGRIVILGAGPTGLGAAWRLTELGYDNFRVCERNPYPGGLSASFTDENGFTWDIGGHVLFSHYTDFDKLMDSLLGDEWNHHRRKSWIWLMNRFVPYPFQYNIRHLPPELQRKCTDDLQQAASVSTNNKPENFQEWIEASFGKSIAQIFMLPYNFKVWAHPPQVMSYNWIGDRIATVDIERLRRNIIEERDDVAWGPNNTFRFPARGGTGEIWRRLSNRIPQKNIHFTRTAASIETTNRRVAFTDDMFENYDILINTTPLDSFIKMSDLDTLQEAAAQLKYSTIHIVGIGLRGSPPDSLKNKCWMYFPEDNCPFFRATVFSNYSQNNVPDISGQWSLMAEVSESPYKPVDRSNLIENVIDGMLDTRLIESQKDIIDTWNFTAEHGYPNPSLERNSILEIIQPELEKINIYSRGRFGGWKYEVGNQDHSLMQGVEIVDRLLLDTEEITYPHPEKINQ